mmetsp:Transcript_19469/g.22104  ORF Transcript_19469/g.22104 Transcript_19469/m.22104 type:complete len:89 (+) Transcript_19469:287-553(+)
MVISTATRPTKTGPFKAFEAEDVSGARHLVVRWSKYKKMAPKLKRQTSVNCKLCGMKLESLRFYREHLRIHNQTREQGKNQITTSKTG